MKAASWNRSAACLAAVVLGVVVLTACGAQTQAPAAGPGSPSRGGGSVSDAELVFYRSQPIGLRRNVATILRTQADAHAFPGWLGAKAPADLEAKLTEAARPGRVLVAFARAVGCTSAGSARLVDAGSGPAPNFDLRLLNATTYPECFAQNDVVAVFSLPADAVEQDVQLNGHPADPPGPA